MYEYYQSLDQNSYTLLFADKHVVGKIHLKANDPENVFFWASYYSPDSAKQAKKFLNLGDAFQWLKSMNDEEIIGDNGC